jgi:predicted nucleic acid-binding Zn ribbon protein
MARIPEYGTHNGIKYNPRRTLVRWCIICNIPFHPTGRTDKVCSQECRQQKEYNRNFENNPSNMQARIYKPNLTQEEKERWAITWKRWYNNMTPEQRKKYNDKKKRGATKKQDTYEGIQREMEALGLR